MLLCMFCRQCINFI